MDWEHSRECDPIFGIQWYCLGWGVCPCLSTSTMSVWMMFILPVMSSWSPHRSKLTVLRGWSLESIKLWECGRLVVAVFILALLICLLLNVQAFPVSPPRLHMCSCQWGGRRKVSGAGQSHEEEECQARRRPGQFLCFRMPCLMLSCR